MDIRNLNNNNKLIEKLQCSLSMPSTTHTYSVITEFVRKWFLSKFTGQYFKHVHIEGKHVFDDFRKFDMSEVLKRQKPLLAIIPKINLEYNRGMLDTNMFGIDMMMKTGRLERAVIRDYTRNVFIGTTLEQLELKYTFMMKVDSKAQQIDLYKYMTMAFSTGHVLEETIDLDFHLPYSMMVQLAKDSGFEVQDGSVKNVIEFVRHVNSISRLPVTFKYRTINGKMEFFIRYNNMEIIIEQESQLNYDDGEKRGMLHKNYGLEMEITVRAPSPKFFVYYSSNEHDIIQNISTIDPNSTTDTIYPIYTIEFETVPKINEKGWNQYILTDYYEPIDEQLLTIDFKGLFEEGADIYRVINLNNSIGVSPDNFIDFKIYNGNSSLIPYTMDWETVQMTLDTLIESETTTISIYIDTDYVFEKIKEMDQMEKTRLKRV